MSKEYYRKQIADKRKDIIDLREDKKKRAEKKKKDLNYLSDRIKYSS